MKGHIIYSSKYGATEQYARWIAEATGFEILNYRKVRALPPQGPLVVGCSVLAGKPTLTKWLTKHLAGSPQREVILFTTSGAPKEDPQHETNFQAAFPGALSRQIRLFPLGGRMIFSKLSWMDRQFMKLGAKILGKKDPALGKKMLEDVDRVRREDLAPLLAALKG
jgi:menaquinone-dependent protoporphyrinogen IX oxidase